MWGFLPPKTMASTLPVIFGIVSILRFLYMALEAHRTVGMRKSQAVCLAWWTLLRILNTFLNASTWNVCHACRISYCFIWFWFSILSLGWACVDCTAYVYTQWHRWARKLLFPGCPALVQCWGLPNHRRICLLHLHQFIIFSWCVLRHCTGVVRSSHASAPYHGCSSIALSNLSRNSPPTVSPAYVGSSLASVIT